MLSTGLIDCFSSQVDAKGKIGPTSLKENVCQVRSAYFSASILVRVFYTLLTLEHLPEKRIRPICHCAYEYPCRCVRGRGTYWCVMATATEPFTLSVLAYQQHPREGSSAVNAALVCVLTLSLCLILTQSQKCLCVNRCCLLPSGVHSCFVCKKSGNGVRRCMIPLCGKFYHNDCITTFSATQPYNKGVRCPLHVCLSCHITNPHSNCSKGRLRFWINVHSISTELEYTGHNT